MRKAIFRTKTAYDWYKNFEKRLQIISFEKRCLCKVLLEYWRYFNEIEAKSYFKKRIIAWNNQLSQKNIIVSKFENKRRWQEYQSFGRTSPYIVKGLITYQRSVFKCDYKITLHN